MSAPSFKPQWLGPQAKSTSGPSPGGRDAKTHSGSDHKGKSNPRDKGKEDTGPSGGGRGSRNNGRSGGHASSSRGRGGGNGHRSNYPSRPIGQREEDDRPVRLSSSHGSPSPGSDALTATSGNASGAAPGRGAERGPAGRRSQREGTGNRHPGTYEESFPTLGQKKTTGLREALSRPIANTQQSNATPSPWSANSGKKGQVQSLSASTGSMSSQTGNNNGTGASGQSSDPLSRSTPGMSSSGVSDIEKSRARVLVPTSRAHSVRTTSTRARGGSGATGGRRGGGGGGAGPKVLRKKGNRATPTMPLSASVGSTSATAVTATDSSSSVAPVVLKSSASRNSFFKDLRRQQDQAAQGTSGSVSASSSSSVVIPSLEPSALSSSTESPIDVAAVSVVASVDPVPPPPVAQPVVTAQRRGQETGAAVTSVRSDVTSVSLGPPPGLEFFASGTQPSGQRGQAAPIAPRVNTSPFPPPATDGSHRLGSGPFSTLPASSHGVFHPHADHASIAHHHHVANLVPGDGAVGVAEDDDIQVAAEEAFMRQLGWDPDGLGDDDDEDWQLTEEEMRAFKAKMDA